MMPRGRTTREEWSRDGSVRPSACLTVGVHRTSERVCGAESVQQAAAARGRTLHAARGMAHRPLDVVDDGGEDDERDEDEEDEHREGRRRLVQASARQDEHPLQVLRHLEDARDAEDPDDAQHLWPYTWPWGQVRQRGKKSSVSFGAAWQPQGHGLAVGSEMLGRSPRARRAAPILRMQRGELTAASRALASRRPL